jgi:hypothetical protein
MIIQLATEIAEYVLVALSNSGSPSDLALRFEQFQPAWMLVMAILWLSLRQTLQNFTPNAGRVVCQIHAATTCLMGFPVMWLLCTPSCSYSDMLESFYTNRFAMQVTANVVCYASTGYFIMDSFFIARTSYLKHHLGAIAAYLLTAYHHESSLILSVCTMSLFEMGAILVQTSRVFPNLFCRTLICIGYTSTRIGLAWFYGFIYTLGATYLAVGDWKTYAVLYSLYTCLVFLLGMNFNWCFLQWRALIRAFVSKQSPDFYSYHQKIIGNTATPTVTVASS